MNTNLNFLYQLQNATFDQLSRQRFELGVIDTDDSGITAQQLDILHSQGKDLWAYISVGEAENWRDYYTASNWEANPPDFVIGQNPNWSSAVRVEFWQPEWKAVVLGRIDELIGLGLDGAYLDVVDVFTVPEVMARYQEDFPGGDVAKAMEDFIIEISQYAKAQDPGFKIVVQNGITLLTNEQNVNPGDTVTPNTRYLDAIDGVGKESTFALGDTYPISWGPWDATYVTAAIDYGKFVIGLEYPTTDDALQYSLEQTIQAGYMPYFDTREHDGNFLDANYDVPALADTASFLAEATRQTAVATAAPSTSAGDDYVVGDETDNIFIGMEGDDTIYGLDGDDTLTGDAGDDSLLGWNGDDSLIGGTGDDSLFGDWGDDTLDGGDGDDVLYGWDGDDVLHAGDGSNIIYGDGGADLVTAGANSSNTVYAGDADDTIDGGNGNDYLFGDAGNDHIDALDGDDSLYGWTGNDTINAGSGNDYVFADADDDLVDAGNGDDVIYGGTGNDTLYGSGGDDWLLGGEGNDNIDAGSGDDVIYAWSGDDFLYGGNGDDFISGEEGNDTLHGGSGSDELYGGQGNDRLIFAQGDNVATLRDFMQGVDLIDIKGFGISTFSDIAANIFYANGNATIAFSSGDSLTIDNIADGALTASDFVFTSL